MKAKMAISAILMAGLFFATASLAAEIVSGVARVKDGDSLVVSGREIRLSGIDAPEMKQREGRYSAAALRRHLADRVVRCRGLESDKYGRLLATCTVDRRSINMWMVKRGLAFAYWPFRSFDLVRQACPDETMAECHRTSAAYLRTEDKARAKGRGIWHFTPLPVYPWCSRHAGGISCNGPTPLPAPQ